MPLVFYAIDEEFAAATGTNVNVATGESRFDNPPGAVTDLVVTVNDGDTDPRLFEPGDTYDLTWEGDGGPMSIEDAEVVRSDDAPGTGGVIVFEGLDQNGELAHIVWSPNFDLEQWYWDNYNAEAEPQFYVVDTNASYSHAFVCFADDTRIATAMGGVRAADIWAGDRLLTLDNGPQQVQWAGRRVVRGHGANAPVLFAPGTIGNHAPLKLSQQHRVLVRSPLAELMFGASEVLIPAKAMVNGVDICIRSCARVGYVHFALAAHEVLLAEGALARAFCPERWRKPMPACLTGFWPNPIRRRAHCCAMARRWPFWVRARRTRQRRPRARLWPWCFNAG
ncbi:Hint domain-containing protein [Rhodobacteraceae bacterium D3-12]|nr:Hint domain-containing protein [Rhodobacteraceae bacterium D3-12]